MLISPFTLFNNCTFSVSLFALIHLLHCCYLWLKFCLPRPSGSPRERLWNDRYKQQKQLVTEQVFIRNTKAQLNNDRWRCIWTYEKLASPQLAVLCSLPARCTTTDRNTRDKYDCFITDGNLQPHRLFLFLSTWHTGFKLSELTYLLITELFWIKKNRFDQKPGNSFRITDCEWF
jgi:hypothetical protein